MYTVRFFKGENGKSLVREYLNRLAQEAPTNKSSRIKLDKFWEYINVLETLGTRAGATYTKHIEDGIWELRPAADRFFLFYHTGNTFVLLHYFQKKTQKTPRKEIETAKRNRAIYLQGAGI